MTQEIVDAVREIEREKGIETGTLVAALEDALLAAYKKTPGAARHATVELGAAGDFRVFSIELPEDLAARPGADQDAVRARGARDRRRSRRDPRRRPRARLPLEDRGRVARPGCRS